MWLRLFRKNPECFLGGFVSSQRVFEFGSPMVFGDEGAKR